MFATHFISKRKGHLFPFIALFQVLWTIGAIFLGKSDTRTITATQDIWISPEDCHTLANSLPIFYKLNQTLFCLFVSVVGWLASLTAAPAADFFLSLYFCIYLHCTVYTIICLYTGHPSHNCSKMSLGDYPMGIFTTFRRTFHDE